MFLNSTNVEVFPVAKPRSKQTNGGRLFTEKYVANIIRQLIGTNGFIISCTDGQSTTSFSQDASLIIEFNISGYYFKISGQIIKALLSELTAAEKKSKLYLLAKIVGFDTSNEIAGQDEEDLYKGLEVYLSETKQDISNGIVLLELSGKDTGSGMTYTSKPVIDSYQKFDATSVYITEIDGKH